MMMVEMVATVRMVVSMMVMLVPVGQAEHGGMGPSRTAGNRPIGRVSARRKAKQTNKPANERENRPLALSIDRKVYSCPATASTTPARGSAHGGRAC